MLSYSRGALIICILFFDFARFVIRLVCRNRGTLRTQTYRFPAVDFCDVGILSQSQFSSSSPRTTAWGGRCIHTKGHSPVLRCASLLRIILRVISARALENGGFFFTTGHRRRSKSLFSGKRLRWPITFFCSFELSSKFLYVHVK